MLFNQEITLCSPLEMAVPNFFDAAAPTDTPDGNAAGALDHPQLGIPFAATWYSPQQQLLGSGFNTGHTSPGSYGSWDVVSPHPQLDNQVPEVQPLSYSQWLAQRSTRVSPVYNNTHFPMNRAQWSGVSPYEHPNGIPPIQPLVLNTCESKDLPTPGEGDYYDTGKISVSPSYGDTLLPNPTQWSAPSTYGHPYNAPPAPDQGHYNDSYTAFIRGHYPDLPLDKGTVSGMSGAVVGADNSITSAPPVHLHRRGGKKREVAKGLVNDCAYDGKEELLERDESGYAKPRAIYERLQKMKTEAFDHLMFHKDEAHGVSPDGGYICRLHASIVCGLWQKDKEICGRLLQDKDGYRRHIEERHLALRRMVKGKHMPIEGRIRRAQEEIKDFERREAEAEKRPVKKRKRASDEECSGSSPFERHDENQNKRRRDTLYTADR